MSTVFDVVVLGAQICGGNRVRVHHLPVPGETVIAWDYHVYKDGGKGGHQAIVVSRLGGRSVFIGKIGGGPDGDMAVKLLTDDGVDVSFLVRSDELQPRPGLQLITDDGNNAIISIKGIGHTLTFEDAQSRLEDLKDARIFITGFEIPVSTALRSAKLAKSFGMFTILNPAPMQEIIDESLEYIDILAPNEVEAKALLGVPIGEPADMERVSQLLLDKYRVGAVLITMGDKGALYRSPSQVFTVPVIPVRAVNTTGAGDCFIGAFAWALSSGQSIEQAVRLGNCAAAFSVTKDGSIDSFPYRHELDAFVEEGGYSW